MEKRSSLEKKKSKTSHVSETLALIQVTAEYLSKTRDSENNDFYYIKVSGIASGNKLIKAIRYPHM